MLAWSLKENMVFCHLNTRHLWAWCLVQKLMNKGLKSITLLITGTRGAFSVWTDLWIGPLDYRKQWYTVKIFKGRLEVYCRLYEASLKNSWVIDGSHVMPAVTDLTVGPAICRARQDFCGSVGHFLIASQLSGQREQHSSIVRFRFWHYSPHFTGWKWW